jgi:hypothetical protein
MDAITRSKGILGSTREVLTPARNVGSGRYSALLLAAIDHALEFAEKNRPQTVAEWRRELLGETAAASATPAAAGKPVSPTPQPAAPPAAPAGSPSPVLPQAPVIRSAWSSGPIPWAVAGVAAGAIGIAVFLWTGSSEREDRRFRQIQEQLDQAQKRLAEVGDRDGKEREKVLALLAEQQKLENSKRRQEEETRKRLEEKQQLAEARLRKEEEARRRLEEKQRLAEAQLRKEEAARKRLEEQQRLAEATRRREEQERVALAKPSEPAPAARPSPQEEQLAMGEAALARREYDEALKILRPLAQGGEVRAQDRLAEMYANGFGVTRNYNQAYIWYSLAARGGSTTAPASRDKMARLLQPVEVQQADRLVENWRAR